VEHDASHLLKVLILWVEYHDVILNDNTAKTNQYNMPLSLFLTIDNNTRSRLIAQALVSDETTESYKWILECTKSATMSELLVFVHCIYHINENLPKNTKSKLSNQYEEFVHDSYLCHNSLCEELFHERWSKLIEKYPSVKEYLMKTLYPSRQAWARVYTSKIFTAGVQTTSRVEGYNNIIKRELASNSTLCNLANVLDARLESEVQWNRFFEYHTLSTCMGIRLVSNDLFPKIDKLMSEYLSPHRIKHY
jgi:MULE transposase domain